MFDRWVDKEWFDFDSIPRSETSFRHHLNSSITEDRKRESFVRVCLTVVIASNRSIVNLYELTSLSESNLSALPVQTYIINIIINIPK